MIVMVFVIAGLSISSVVYKTSVAVDQCLTGAYIGEVSKLGRNQRGGVTGHNQWGGVTGGWRSAKIPAPSLCCSFWKSGYVPKYCLNSSLISVSLFVQLL